jgi:isochorismate synthase EntC
MQIIEEHESTRRGIYGGAIGYIDFTGNIDTCIAIRTAVIYDGKAYVQAGAGIVADSDPESEIKSAAIKQLPFWALFMQRMHWLQIHEQHIYLCFFNRNRLIAHFFPIFSISSIK